MHQAIGCVIAIMLYDTPQLFGVPFTCIYMCEEIILYTKFIKYLFMNMSFIHGFTCMIHLCISYECTVIVYLMWLIYNVHVYAKITLITDISLTCTHTYIYIYMD